MDAIRKSRPGSGEQDRLIEPFVPGPTVLTVALMVASLCGVNRVSGVLFLSSLAEGYIESLLAQDPVPGD